MESALEHQVTIDFVRLFTPPLENEGYSASPPNNPPKDVQWGPQFPLSLAKQSP